MDEYDKAILTHNHTALESSRRASTSLPASLSYLTASIRRQLDLEASIQNRMGRSLMVICKVLPQDLRSESNKEV